MTDTEEKTTFTFDELSERAKDRVRDERRYYHVDDDWWDYLYEDAQRMGAMMGIEIYDRRFATYGDRGTDKKSGSAPAISFCGFASQGDGASFSGTYRYEPGAVAKITSECSDPELIRIATELTALQVALKLEHGFTISATIANDRGSYCHSGYMAVEARLDDDDFDVLSGEDDTLTKLMRDFADWIYKQLEAEHDHLTSDEHLDERIADEALLFDEDGDII